MLLGEAVIALSEVDSVPDAVVLVGADCETSCVIVAVIVIVVNVPAAEVDSVDDARESVVDKTSDDDSATAALIIGVGIGRFERIEATEDPLTGSMPVALTGRVAFAESGSGSGSSAS